jgi:myo-inositol-1-phosphate synthase
MGKIKVALVGIGNCASSLVQGRYYYEDTRQPAGLMHERIGGYGVPDIQFVLAIDTDARKVGRDLAEAIFAAPNCTVIFHKLVPATGVTVRMGRVLDGMAPHMEEAGERGFVRSGAPEPDEAEVVAALKETGAEILVNFLPVGSEEATRFYMECALKAGVAVVNCMPVFIASDPEWENRFREKRLPIIGDDIKAQLGATIVHRVLTSTPAAIPTS